MKSFQIKNELAKIFLCFTLIAVFSASASAQEEWYMIFGAGDAPKRAAFFVDMNSVSAAAGVTRINFVNVFEAAGNPQYTLSVMEFRCAKNEWRIASGENYTFENTVVPFKDSPWEKNSNPLFERVKNLACNEQGFAKAKAMATDAAGKTDGTKLNAELEKSGLDGGVILLTSSVVADFDSVLEILWSKFWKAKRPQRSGIAKNTAKTTNPKPRAKPNGKAEVFVKSGAEQIKTGHYDKALADFAKAIQIEPRNSPAYFYRGFIFADVGEYDLAIAAYTKALEFAPNDLSSYYNRGLIYFEQKHKFDLAEADFTKAIQGDPQNAQAYFTRADLYESWGKDALATADRKKFQSLGGNALPGFQNRRRTLFPLAEFDSETAANALQQGNSTLIGRACALVSNGLFEVGGTKFDAANVRVTLYPVTPYMEKWHQLREKKEDKKTGVFINREAQKYAMMTQTNGKGEFVFSRLKPGKYFLQIIFNFTQIKTKRIYTGSDTTQNGPVRTTTDYYEDREFFIDRNNRLESFVEIKSDGESKKVTVKNKKISLFGCKDLF